MKIRHHENRMPIPSLLTAGLFVLDVTLLLALLSPPARIVLINTVMVLMTNPFGTAPEP